MQDDCGYFLIIISGKLAYVESVHSYLYLNTHTYILLHILCQTPIFINQVCAQFNKKILT